MGKKSHFAAQSDQRETLRFFSLNDENIYIIDLTFIKLIKMNGTVLLNKGTLLYAFFFLLSYRGFLTSW